MNKATIMIAEDQPLIRDGLAAILTLEGGYTVVAKTGDGLTTIEQVRLHRPDLVLMDIHMPKMDGLQATKQIKSAFPDTKILILTTFEDEQYIWEAIRYGAGGFLVKGVETEKIISTIRDCLDGRINYPSSIQPRLLREFDAPPPEQRAGRSPQQRSASVSPDPQRGERWSHLSAQERNILRYLRQGKSNREIAAGLFLTIGTVKNYLSAIYKKLEVSSRSEAIAYLHQEDM